MRLITSNAKLMAAALVLSCSVAAADPGWTPLDARRVEALRLLDARYRTAGEDAAFPGPNLRLRSDHHEYYYQEKAGAIFGLVEAGHATKSRLAEANKLLRLEMLGRWPITAPGQLQGDSGIWMHRSRTLGMRLYLLYSPWMDEDLRAEYARRMEWMVREPFNRKSENIKLTNNSAYFLSHEALGKTGAPSYGEVKSWLVRYLRQHGTQGTHEWGSYYNAWTFVAILNLAEFARDAEVRTLASMVVDYDIARMLTMSVRGNFCSPAVRRYFFWTVNGAIEPQTHLLRLLFTSEEPRQGIWADWALSNYAPLQRHQHFLSLKTPCEARFTDDAQTGRGIRWLSRICRGRDFAIATHQTVGANGYVLPSGGTHDIIGCYVQSGKDPAHHIVPYGHNPGMVPKKKRNRTERYFGYKNMAFVQHGGVTKAVWAGGVVTDVPIRLFYQAGFTCELTEHWAFLSDGATYAAWAPTVGTPRHDPSLKEISDPKKEGAWLRSTHVPGEEGEVAVIEAGDADLFGSFEAFKRDILSRNPAPRVEDGRVVYTAHDGAEVVFGQDHASVNGERFDPASYPQASGPGIERNRLEGGERTLVFDFENATCQGEAQRVPSALRFGSEAPYRGLASSR